jgi:hypothetical protein
MSDSQSGELPKKQGPRGLGGFLIIPIAVNFIQPIFVFKPVSTGLEQIVRMLSQHELFSYVSYQIVVYAAVGFAWMYALVPLFTKRRVYPRFFVILSLITSVLPIVDFGFVLISYPQVRTDPFINRNVSSIVVHLVAVVIWSSYILVSRRAKNTFVN